MGKSETLLAFIKDRPGHDRRYALNCKKAGEELGWKPTIPLDEGLRQTIKWYESNADLLARVHAGEYRSYYERSYDSRDSSLHAIVASEPVSIAPSASDSKSMSMEAGLSVTWQSAPGCQTHARRLRNSTNFSVAH